MAVVAAPVTVLCIDRQYHAPQNELVFELNLLWNRSINRLPVQQKAGLVSGCVAFAKPRNRGVLLLRAFAR
jgi:hypothetical protein